MAARKKTTKRPAKKTRTTKTGARKKKTTTRKAPAKRTTRTTKRGAKKKTATRGTRKIGGARRTRADEMRSNERALEGETDGGYGFERDMGHEEDQNEE